MSFIAVTSINVDRTHIAYRGVRAHVRDLSLPLVSMFGKTVSSTTCVSELQSLTASCETWNYETRRQVDGGGDYWGTLKSMTPYVKRSGKRRRESFFKIYIELVV